MIFCGVFAGTVLGQFGSDVDKLDKWLAAVSSAGDTPHKFDFRYQLFKLQCDMNIEHSLRASGIIPPVTQAGVIGAVQRGGCVGLQVNGAGGPSQGYVVLGHCQPDPAGEVVAVGHLHSSYSITVTMFLCQPLPTL